MDFTPEQFNAAKPTMLEGLRSALESTSFSELEKELNKNLAQQQGTQSEIQVRKPRLVGEPEITDQWLRFTLLADVKLRKKLSPWHARQRPQLFTIGWFTFIPTQGMRMLIR